MYQQTDYGYNPCMAQKGSGIGFAFILVLFILLVIIGSPYI